MFLRGSVILLISLTGVVTCHGKAVQGARAVNTNLTAENLHESARRALESKLSNSDENVFDKSASVFDGKRCGRRRNLFLLAALSKIAKISSADETQDGCEEGRGLGASSKSVETLPGLSDRQDIVQRLPTSGLEGSTIRVKRKYHCHAIRDIRVPGVSEKMPAYSCKLENRRFILSSPRFLQDRRSYFDVDVGEDVDRQLKSVSSVSNSSRLSVVEAMLVLKLGDENYGLRGQGDNTKKRQRNGSRSGR